MKRKTGKSLLDVRDSPSLVNWDEPGVADLPEDVVVDCGWGRLLFGHTFRDPGRLVSELCAEQEGRRDLALYLRDPHVILALAPQELFLDPSHTFRLLLPDGMPEPAASAGCRVRPVQSRADAAAIGRLFQAVGMVPVDAGFVWEHRAGGCLTYLVAEDLQDGSIVGTVTGADHVRAFEDPERGTSLWTLAVDPQARLPGIGEALVRRLAVLYRERGRHFLDLSVLASNESAIALYRKLGFVRVPAFCVKHKQNPINEPLFAPPAEAPRLNPYAGIIVDEARRRGVLVEVLDAAHGYLRLSHGGRAVTCRESLSELTNAVAMSRCQDKRVTRAVLTAASLRVPDQAEAATPERNEAFLRRHGRLVVKPALGEQGQGISVDVRDARGLEEAVARAHCYGDVVLLEEYASGQDLRVIVIDGAVVAAAVRRPPAIVGTGTRTVRELIEKQSRRRRAATGGESGIPVDGETERCVATAGFGLDDVLPEGDELVVRKTANLHTGGTIHDVTPRLHPALADTCVAAATAIDIPVTGLDLIVPDVEGPEYVLIEANERPGLANHEPQPTAERFLDLLFPNTRTPASSRRDPA